ncbi:Vacuolar protein sorting-associated protein 51 [Gigaspora margarita]|uniref:Vacuolar protein sorting-associated protein 51 homolog n=1 Tax=Gigaspora margarita TaxID=4874 RepID=A0A8H3XDR5_GIGMA|nr:Vacuolar protein sorting-associated protein 51 [Gigaspora margarita]
MTTPQQVPTSPSKSSASTSKSVKPITLTLPRKSRTKSHGIGTGGKNSDPLDIDNSAFEAEHYCNVLLIEKHLSELIQRDNDLSTEIRQLDGDMKTLVYENYNKFISATDTIRKMKSNVESMESEMDQLSKSISNISNVTSLVNDALGPKREKIRQLTGVHDLLKKIQFIFELPTRLKLCLDQESYAQAVRYYAKTSRLLEHYRSLSVFSSIESECKEIIDKVSKKIRENMTSENATGSEITDCIVLLISLKEPPQQLAKEYLDLQETVLSKLLVATIDEMPKIPADYLLKSSEDYQLTTSDERAIIELTYLNEKFLKELNKFVESFNGFFLQPPKECRDTKSPGKSPAKSPKNNDLIRYVSTTLDVEVKELVRKEFLEFIGAITSEYLTIVDGLLEFPNNILDFKPETHIKLLNKLNFAALSCASLSSVIKFDERIKEVISTWETGIGKRLFGNAEKELIEKFVEFSEKQKTKVFSSSQQRFKYVQTFVLDTETWLTTYLTKDCLRIIKECVKTEVPMFENKDDVEKFLKKIQAEFREFWYSIINSMMKYVSPINPYPINPQDPPPPITSLIMSRMLLDFGEIIVTQVYTSFSDRLYTSRDNRNRFAIDVYGGYGERHSISKELAQDVREIVGVCKDIAQRILERYVEIVGNRISMNIRGIYTMKSSITNLTDVPSRPTSVSKIWNVIITELTLIEKEVVMLYGTEEENNLDDQDSNSLPSTDQNSTANQDNSNTIRAPYAHSNSSYSSINSNRPKSSNPFFASFTHLTSHIDKLFSDRIEIFGIVEIGKPGIMMGVIKILLKAWIETVRMQTLTNKIFQQIQVDSEFVRLKLWKYIEDERILNTMLQELASSAFRRCAEDPLPLENTVSDP